MGLIDSAIDAFRFKETVFYKESTYLQSKYDALKKLNEEYPNNEDLLSEMYIVKKGLDGENEIGYQLKKAHIGMYVLRDIKVKYEDMTAQIDYVIITPVYTYYVECKNLVGNITVTDKGDFIREFTINGRKIKKGMYSPLRQVEAQREVIRKIWESNSSAIKKFFASKNFDYYRRVLVVAANQDTILNTNRAPKEMKYKILRADALVRQIEYDLVHRGNDEYLESKKGMEEMAQYVNLYTYGRRYNDKYYQEHDAFIAGYNDGFCYVNRCNTFVVGYGNGDAEKGYEQYYPIDESKRTGTKISKVLQYNSSTSTGGIYGNDTTITGLIRSEELRNELEKNKKQYPDMVNGTLVKRIDEKGFEIEISMYCGELNKDNCSKSFEYIIKFILDKQSETYADSEITIEIKE